MAFNQDGVNIVITGNASQAMLEIRKVESSINGLLSLEVGSKLQAGFGAMFQTIASSLNRVAQAVSSIVRNALAIGGGFEAQMTAVKVISGAAENELDALTKKAREMGATLPITAKDAAQAMTLLAQRGNDAHKILASVQAVANLSISQAVDMASAADILGSTITNFAMSVDEADKITAIFNNACNQSALNMSKLIEAMKYVGPAANSVKMPLTEAVAAMEAIANAGLTGEMTGTGLAMVLTKLAMKANISGVETKNLDNSMRSLSDIFLELSKREYTLANAVADFGQRGSKAALALINNAASLARNEERLKQWGSTQNAVNEKMKTFTNTLNAFRSASEELHIEIFEQIKVQAKDAVGSLANLTRAFSKWVGETQIAGDTLNAFLEGLGFKLPSVENLQSLLRNFNIQGFLDNVKSFGTALKGIADSIVWAFGMIKAPLAFLIEHLGAFTAISFWGWIIGKGLQVPAAIIGIAGSMTQLYSAGKKLLSLSWTTLMSPLGATLTAAGILTVVVGSKVLEARKVEQEFNDIIDRIQNEIKDADADLKLRIDAGDFITGFEKLPDSFFKANDELRQNTLNTVKALQSEFKDKYAKAVDYVAEKFPTLTALAVSSGIDIQNASQETIQQITNALHGGEEEFKKLSPFLQAVVEQINLLDIYAGKGSESLLNIIKQIKEAKDEAESLKPENKFKTLFQNVNDVLHDVLNDIHTTFNEANEALGGSNIELAFDISFTKAEDAVKSFAKEMSKKFALPKEVIQESVIIQLKDLARQGNSTARAFIEHWKDADKSFDDFFNSAKDAINYLGEAPQSFVPALTHLINGIQRIDPITGKLTEKFKKAHDALKEWANVTFDKLTNRIQKLRKAVEGGFIDKSELEKEFKNVMPQIKLQVISELEPFRGQFNSKNAYAATLASDFINNVIDIFGDAGEEMVKKIYQGMSGAEIGKAILRDNQRSLSGGNNTIAYINGIEQGIIKSVNSLSDTIGALYFNLDQLTTHEYEVNDNIFSFSIAETVDLFSKEFSHFAGDFGERAKGVADSFSSTLAPVNSSIQLLNNTLGNNTNALSRAGDSMLGLINSIQTPSSNTVASIKDYSADFASVINALNNINSSAQANISAVNSVGDAVRAINFQPVNEENIARSILNGFTPVLNALDKFQSSTENASANISTLTSSINGLRTSADNNVSALGNLQAAIASSSGEQNISGAIVPLTNAVQNLDNALNVLASTQQNNSNALADVLAAVREIYSVVSKINSGNTYNIDIQQQGFMIEKKSDADYLARNTATAIRSGLGNGGV